MIAAGIHVEDRRLVACVTNVLGAARYLAAARTPDATAALARALRAGGIQDVVLAEPALALAPTLVAAGLDVWIAPRLLVADLLHIGGRRAGSRARAALFSRLACTQNLQTSLRTYAPPPTPPLLPIPLTLV